MCAGNLIIRACVWVCSSRCDVCREPDHQSCSDRAGPEGLPAGPMALPVPEWAPPGLPLQRQQALLLRHVALQEVHCRCRPLHALHFLSCIAIDSSISDSIDFYLHFPFAFHMACVMLQAATPKSSLVCLNEGVHFCKLFCTLSVLPVLAYKVYHADSLLWYEVSSFSCQQARQQT